MASRTLPPTRYSRQPAAAKRSARGAVSSRRGRRRSGTIATTRYRPVREAPPPVRLAAGMTTVAAEVLQWGWERARTGPWRGDGQIAYLAPLAPAGAPSVDFLHRCLDTLAARGFARVVTSALAPAEQGGFLAVGFEEYERLHLLSHDLQDVPRARRGRRATPPAGPARRTGRRCWPSTPAPSPRSGGSTPSGLRRGHRRHARRPASGWPRRRRARPGCWPTPSPGSSGNQGYLQRLAVHPDHRRARPGPGPRPRRPALAAAQGVSEAVVNTQLGNDAALALYLSLGFRAGAHPALRAPPAAGLRGPGPRRGGAVGGGGGLAVLALAVVGRDRRPRAAAAPPAVGAPAGRGRQ